MSHDIFLQQNNSVLFFPRSMTYLVLVPGHQNTARNKFQVMERGVKFSKIMVDYFPNFCTSTVSVYHVGRSPLYTEGFIALLVLPFPLVSSMLSSTIHTSH